MAIINAKDFVDQISALKPEGSLVSESLKRDFKIVVRDAKSSSIGGETMLNELFSLFNPKSLGFGDFRFHDKIIIVDEIWENYASSSFSFIGKRADDDLLWEIDSHSGNLLEMVARDGKSFLEAVIILMELYSTKLQNRGLSYKEKFNLNKKYLELSVEAAGGQDYFSFYQNVIQP